MPEGPECKIIAEELDFLLYNVTLKKVTVIGGKYLSQPLEGLEELPLPLTFKSVTSKGKMIIFSFKEQDLWKLYVGLGMSGTFSLEKTNHSHVEFDLEMSPPFPNKLYYNDVRRFGNLYFSTTDKSAKLAPSIFDISVEEFLTRSKLNTSLLVPEILMNQEKVCSGIGNYMVAEILYDAGIYPLKKFSSLTEKELTKIHQSAVNIALKSYDNGGVSIKDFVSPFGTKGKYQEQLKVYGKTRTSKGETVLKHVKNSRTLWYVESSSGILKVETSEK